MIKFLSDIGRGFVIVGAFVTIFVSTYEAYLYKDDIISVGIGFLGGCIIAGFTFGIVATLYDIRDNLRVLVERETAAKIVSHPYMAPVDDDGVDDLRAL